MNSAEVVIRREPGIDRNKSLVQHYFKFNLHYGTCIYVCMYVYIYIYIFINSKIKIECICRAMRMDMSIRIPHCMILPIDCDMVSQKKMIIGVYVYAILVD